MTVADRKRAKKFKRNRQRSVAAWQVKTTRMTKPSCSVRNAVLESPAHGPPGV